MKLLVASLLLLTWCLRAQECELGVIIGPPAPPPPPPPSTNDPLSLLAGTLPIEVLGPDQTVASFDLVSVSAPSADWLYLQIHGLTYAGKASVRVNDGGWMTLTDGNVTYLHAPDLAFWGMGGPQSSLRFKVPTTGWPLVSGTNRVQFKFNDLDGLTVGFRVLALNLLAGTNLLVPTNAFVLEDPSTWSPPSTNSADINAGRDAWYGLQISEPTRGVLHARCTDCHAHDGRDLKYFNYSTLSIIERAVFHNVPRTTATNIASYIRSLNVPYEPRARPWNPPYQPGPGLDSLPVRSWAAGAGLEWVLNTDLETLNYLFPAGITTNALNYRDGTVNARHVPLAVQFPDWNHWLPQIHPFDAYPGYYGTNSATTNAYVRLYYTIRTNLSTLSGAAAAVAFRDKRDDWDRPSTTGGIASPDPEDPAYPAYRKLKQGIMKWRLTKTWEIMTEEQIEEMGTELFGGQSTDRRWFHGEPFNIGPHRLKLPHTDSFAAESMQWYQLQLTLNDANKKGGNIAPIDWGYQHALNATAWSNPSNTPTYGIMILNMIKGHESQANARPLADVHGWRLGNGKIVNLAPGSTRTNGYKQIPLPLRVQVAEAIVVPWLDECEKWSVDDWAEASQITNGDRDFVVALARGLKGIGINAAIQNRLVDFAESLWTAHDWSPYRP